LGESARRIASAAIALWLCGCAAREVTPVRMQQPGDDDLTCTQIDQQIADNLKAAQDFMKKDKSVENANIAKNVGGAIPGLGLLLVASTDLSNEEQIEGRAILDRNEQLTYLAKKKGCTQ
jgi:hypothetical protein